MTRNQFCQIPAHKCSVVRKEGFKITTLHFTSATNHHAGCEQAKYWPHGVVQHIYAWNVEFQPKESTGVINEYLNENHECIQTYFNSFKTNRERFDTT
jgi:hypothetical protein